MGDISKRPDPREGEIYRHFKGSLYKIVAIAVHTESSDKLVVYRSVERPDRVFARPLPMFMSEVDRLRYPFVRQKYRFALETDEEETKEPTITEVETIEKSEALTEQETAEEKMTEEETEPSYEAADEAEEEPAYEVAEEPADEAEEEPVAAQNQETIEEQVTTENTLYKEDGTLALDPVVEAILDEKDFTKKIENFELLRGKCTDDMLTMLAISLDVQISGNSIDEKYAEILKTLRMHEKYESARLR